MTDVPFDLAGTDSGIHIDGAWPAGTTFTVTWTNVHVVTPCGPFGYQVNIVADPGNHQPGTLRYPLNSASGRVDFTIPAPATRFSVGANTNSFCSAGTLFGVLVSWTAPPGGFCPYGTQPINPLQPPLYLTPELLGQWLTRLGANALLGRFSPLFYTVLSVDNLCGALPPPFTQATVDNLDASPQALLELVKSMAWLNLCECKPGAPAPQPPPDPTVVVGPGVPVSPTFGCSEIDLCATLIAIRQQLAAIALTVGTDLELDTLVQRYRVPFAYIAGATHSNLAGNGSFHVTRLVGLQVVITASPTSPIVLEGNPGYVWDVGWMSVSDGGGMLQEKRITRQSFTWFPDSMQEATTFGWFMKDGYQISVGELEAEP